VNRVLRRWRAAALVLARRWRDRRREAARRREARRDALLKGWCTGWQTAASRQNHTVPIRTGRMRRGGSGTVTVVNHVPGSGGAGGSGRVRIKS
jgi:hypothetical protein